MSGNVWELTQDCYDCRRHRRVRRGGSWGNEPTDLRAVSRSIIFASDRDFGTGFRVARTLP